MRIVYVDGFKIRNSVDIDFGIIDWRALGGFAPTWYIPEREFWIEKRVKDETGFLIKASEMENKLSSKLSSFKKVRKVLAKKFCSFPPPPIEKFTKKKYTREKLLIRGVDGGVVRKYFDPLFVIGGHYLVYNYVPKKEIWLDAKMDPREMRYHLIHELTECKLLAKGLDYDTAHEYATAADKELRRKDGIVFPGDEDTKNVLKDKPRRAMLDLLLSKIKI